MTGHHYVCGRILVVDDDETFRALVTTMLETAGFACAEAASGPAALALVRGAELPRLVVLDVQLPGISGYEVCRVLRDEVGDSLPILFVSGVRTDPLDRAAGLLLGADDYLVKPFAPDELLARIRALLRRGRPSVATNGNWGLTRREGEVLRLLARGLSQPEIASRLTISHKTVGTHIEHILRKTGARSRAQAVALAYGGELGVARQTAG